MIEVGSKSKEVICLVDFMATAAELSAASLPENAAEDSVSLMPILRGDKLSSPLHEAIINHSISGFFAVRKGQWKLEFCRGSGGWFDPKENAVSKEAPAIQLYNIYKNQKEQKNVYKEHPEIVKELTDI